MLSDVTLFVYFDIFNRVNSFLRRETCSLDTLLPFSCKIGKGASWRRAFIWGSVLHIPSIKAAGFVPWLQVHMPQSQAAGNRVIWLIGCLWVTTAPLHVSPLHDEREVQSRWQFKSLLSMQRAAGGRFPYNVTIIPRTRSKNQPCPHGSFLTRP
jgi:hypothetical protein